MSDQNGFAEWGGYMEAKMTKLEEQFTAASASFRKSNLFAGISIYVNGLTNPSADELKRIMSVHGGIYHHYERSYTTYVIASNLPDVKVRNMDTSKIISAQWVVDCLAANRILDYTKYLLYTNQKTSQPRLNFAKSKKEEPPDKQKIRELDTIKQELAELNAKILESKVESEKIQIAGRLNAEEQKPKLSKPTNANAGTARTAVDPKFLPEFYNNSRLHHIATLGADLKQYVTELREKHDDNLGFPARQKLREKLQLSMTDTLKTFNGTVGASLIMHIDMDCFFVSVGLRNHPHLRGQPVAVTHSKGGPGAADVPVHPKANREAEMELFAKRFEQHLHNNILSDKVRNGFDAKMSLSEIASCSYEARSKGIRNGMFVGQAIKLCPELKTIPYDFDGYKEVAYTLYNTIAQYTLRIEAVSCDEMFVDLSDVIGELNVAPMDFVRAIRDEVRKNTGCPCSAGVGANKLQARLATRRAKPDGQFYLEVDHVEDYMANIPAADLPGVGSSANYVLKQAGYKTCGDLQQLTLTKLQSLLGKKCGETLYHFCRGIDNRPLNYEQVRKSVSAEVNYGIRFKEDAEVSNFLRQLSKEVHSRLCQIKRKTKCVTLKVMVRAADAPVETSKFMGHGVCDFFTKSETFVNFTNDLDVITNSILKIMQSLNKPPQELRGIGIQLTKLDQSSEASQTSKDNSIKNMFSKLKEKQKEATTQLCSHSSTETEKQQSKRAIPQLIPIANLHAAKPTISKRPNVLTMLQQPNAKKRKDQLVTTVTSTSEDLDLRNLPADIDLEVFAALPIDIRKEILKDSKAHQIAEAEAAVKNKNDITPIEPINTSSITSSTTRMQSAVVPATITKTKLIAAVNISENILRPDESLILPESGTEIDYAPSTSRAAREREEQRQREHSSTAQPNEVANAEAMQTNVNPNIDLSFLEALPPHIRSEIEADMAAVVKKSTIFAPGSENAEHAATLRAQSACIQSATSGDVEFSLQNNIFMHPNCKEMLLQWIKTDNKPMENDVLLCCKHARQIAPINLCMLYESLIYLRKLIDRKTSSSDDETRSSWFHSYSDIVRAASNASIPGRTLLTRDKDLSAESN